MENYLSLKVTEEICLVHPELTSAEVIFNLIDSDREHLAEFLDFINTTTKVEDERDFLKMKLTGCAQGTDRMYLIAYQDEIVGCLDLHFINQEYKKAEIGYWIHSTATRKGIVSQCVKTVLRIAFEDLSLNKVILRADVENMGSNGVAMSCGFTLEGTERAAVFFRERFHDMNVYSILKSEF
ncbi:ribosomal-protein-serine acetyltransferase [Enterococcus sp. PF1-24]|uniref:GNAT family N-acetyltransferase n=1 Tax=unclassified Enterococcus TaxID=2608891 RepID=UPI002473C8CF|nr:MULTISPECIES: GNAT family protein [unclassified Enterococcus]MDH6363200.1 ribosomal-protein-serine acetyltransferase [Enterococcus sp. PFB1-1]MDH6400294.1 ribosomal-protein-serine acetyltransferase [Enterococcus sp. PF1-24]